MLFPICIPLPRVAVMGCAVNGPGEAKDADVALCGGDGEFLLYVHGKPVRKVSPTEAVAAVLAAICTPAPHAPGGRAGARPSRMESRHLGG